MGDRADGSDEAKVASPSPERRHKTAARSRASSVADLKTPRAAALAPERVNVTMPAPGHEVSSFAAVKTCMGLDIGGSQAKLVMFFADQTSGPDPVKTFVEANTTYGKTGIRDLSLTFHSEKLKGTFVFIRYLTHQTDGAVDMIVEHSLHNHIFEVHVTGGGAYKYAERLEAGLGLKFHKSDEMVTLVKGICFLAEFAPEEMFTCTNVKFGEELQRVPVEFPSYPFLIVNIGSGVSILKVDSPTSFHRVSGTALGGGTMLGLARLITGANTFDEAMAMAAEGDANEVNQLVRDIYGGDYEAIGLPGSLTASFFNKCSTAEDPKATRNADVCRALCVMLSQNITQIASLCAKIEGVGTVVFTGGFLRGNSIALRTLTFAMNVWSSGTVVPLFLQHEAYFGAMGAFLDTLQSSAARKDEKNAALLAAIDSAESLLNKPPAAAAGSAAAAVARRGAVGEGEGEGEAMK